MAKWPKVARVLDLADVALPEGPPDLIPPQQQRTRALRLNLTVHHSQSETDSFLVGNGLSRGGCSIGKGRRPWQRGGGGCGGRECCDAAEQQGTEAAAMETEERSVVTARTR
jgi:hypothetical protein